MTVEINVSIRPTWIDLRVQFTGVDVSWLKWMYLITLLKAFANPAKYKIADQ
jgi:hypothetical protein